MRRGAVAVIDALGFRGIWRQINPAKMLERLHDLRRKTEDVRRDFNDRYQEQHRVLTGPVEPELNVMSLSDTIVVSANVKGVSDAIKSDVMSLNLATFATSAIITLAAQESPVLVYRGCVAVGEFEVEPPFMIGPAVDEAAAGESLAEAAVVWCSPSAEQAVRKASQIVGEETAKPIGCLRWNVPMKGGGQYQTYAVIPYFRIGDRLPNIDDIQGRILASFDETRLDVAIKKQNTERFLREAATATRNRPP